MKTVGQAKANRLVALVLAIVWFGAGIAALAIGLKNGTWVLSAAGAAAMWYGLLWIQVARKRRKLQWSEALKPSQRS